MSAPCAACGGADLRPHLSVKAADRQSLVATTTAYGVAPADLVRCAMCGHVQVAVLPAQAELDEAYGEVDEGAYLEEEEGQRATARRSLEAIENQVSRGAICDLGCWVGFLLSEAEERGWKAEGVEPSRFAAATARRRFGLSVQNTTLEGADLPAESFDAVVLADVLEHLPRPGAALEQIHALLRPGGVLLLALPDAGSRVARALGSRWWSVLPTHVQYFTRASLTLLLGRHGFTVVQVDTAPKAFTVRYYLSRIEGYSPTAARLATATAERLGVANRLVWPDFRDRMTVVARRSP